MIRGCSKQSNTGTLDCSVFKTISIQILMLLFVFTNVNGDVLLMLIINWNLHLDWLADKNFNLLNVVIC